MKAVVFTDIRSVSVCEVLDAEIEEPTDAVIRVTSSAICGTDLHMRPDIALALFDLDWSGS